MRKHPKIQKFYFGLIGGNIRTLREFRGISRRALATKVGIDYGKLGRIEGGRNLGQDDTIGDISRQLEISIKELLDYHKIADKYEKYEKLE